MALDSLHNIRLQNRLVMLSTIRHNGALTRNELVKLTGLASTTVGDIANELLARNLLLEEQVKKPVPGRGRPGSVLRLNAEAARVVSCILHASGALDVTIVDMVGTVLFEGAATLKVPLLARGFIDLVADTIEKTIAQSGHSLQSISGLGFAVGGTIEPGAGLLHWLPPNPPSPFPLARLLSDRLGIPVAIDSTTNALARFERWFGDCQDVDDFAVVTIGFGIGLGAYVAGDLWHGAEGITPEFGHVKAAVADPAPCICGDVGCLVAEAGVIGMVKKIAARRGEPVPPYPAIPAAFMNYVAAARQGDPVCRAVIEAGTTAMGTALVNHINVWSPSRIVIVSMSAGVEDVLRPTILAAVKLRTFPALQGRTEIVFKLVDDRQAGLGVATAALEQLARW